MSVTATKSPAKVGKNGDKLYTIRQVAEKLDVEYTVANGLINYLVSKKKAKDTGELAPNPNGKGRGARIFSMPSKFEICL